VLSTPDGPINATKPPLKPGILLGQRGRSHRAERIVNHQDQNSYHLSLGDRLRWRFTASPDADSWLNQMAGILGLQAKGDAGWVDVNFTRRSSSLDRLVSRILRRGSTGAEHPAGKRDMPTDGWTMREFGLIRIWSHREFPHVTCELRSQGSDTRELVMMWYALHVIYPGIICGGGLPLHAALVSRDGAGVLLVGGEGAGKSTCCRRMAEIWNVLADDGVLIVPRNGVSYATHPLPTWSDLIAHQSQRTCSVEQRVPLSAIFFIEKAAKSEVFPLGQGHAAAMINASASYVARQGWKNPDPAQDRDFKKLIFDNSCQIAKTVPAFLLRISPSGEFWKQIDHVLGSSAPSPRCTTGFEVNNSDPGQRDSLGGL
jgi:SynChlorMet cassette protein ScmC